MHYHSTFDTYKVIKHLTAEGMPERQATAVVEVMQEVTYFDTSGLATKTDLLAFKNELQADAATIMAEITAVKTGLKAETADLRSELKAETADLRSELKAETAALRADIALVRSEAREFESRMDGRFKDLQIRLGGMIVALGGLLIAIKYFG